MSTTFVDEPRRTNSFGIVVEAARRDEDAVVSHPSAERYRRRGAVDGVSIFTALREPLGPKLASTKMDFVDVRGTLDLRPLRLRRDRNRPALLNGRDGWKTLLRQAP